MNAPTTATGVDYAAWPGTCDTLHLWTQIVGKIRLASSLWTNHSWHVPLYVTTRGLTTSPMEHGRGTFEIAFDFHAHTLAIDTSDGGEKRLPLRAHSVAEFYDELFAALAGLSIHVAIDPLPNEVEQPIAFPEDTVHASYDAAAVTRYFAALLRADRMFKRFRSRFAGKCSPVHFFWGSFDLAVTRFSGRTAPPHPGGVPHLPDWVAREAYSHEVSSLGFWPGNERFPYAAFYAYAYPEPPGYAAARLEPADAAYDPGLHEHILRYDAVMASASPDDAILAFAQSTYEAAADLARWDRAALEASFPPRAAATS